MWLTDLPLEVYALAGIVACCFWSAVVMHRIDKRRLELDEQWQRFIGRKS